MSTADELLERLTADEPGVTFGPKEKSWLITYPTILEYFSTPKQLERQHLIIGAHIVYGWMPTMLDFYSDGSDVTAVHLLNGVRAGDILEPHELEVLIKLVNNSLVGASKLLHFVNPSTYAIWDSRVCHYLHGRQFAMQDAVTRYLALGLDFRTLSGSNALSGIQQSISRKGGSSMTAIRAAELVMFMKAREDAARAAPKKRGRRINRKPLG